MEHSILDRYHQIAPLAGTGVALDADLQEGKIVFRLPGWSVKLQQKGMLAMGLLLIAGSVSQVILSPKGVWAGLCCLLLWGLGQFARYQSARDNHKSQPARFLFSIDTKHSQFIVHAYPGDIRVDLNDIDQFLIWTRVRQSERDTDIRILTHDNRNVVLPIVEGEKIARILGFLCEKPVYQFSPTEVLTQLDTTQDLQLLLRPSARPDSATDLVTPAHAPPDAPAEQLLRASDTDMSQC